MGAPEGRPGEALPVERPLLFTPAAQAEVGGAQDWYEAQVPGLGARFRGELDRTVQRIVENPLQFARIWEDVRRARLRTFPYGVFYRVEPDAVIVIACFHASRDPQKWQQRI